MEKKLTVKVTLAGHLVTKDGEYWVDYNFPKKEQKRAFEIVEDSIYPYSIQHIEEVNGNVVITLKEPQLTWEKSQVKQTDKFITDLVESLKHNYGDGKPDGWMEGDIWLNSKYELWLDLVKVEFYKDNKLYLLFDENVENYQKKDSKFFEDMKNFKKKFFKNG